MSEQDESDRDKCQFLHSDPKTQLQGLQWGGSCLSPSTCEKSGGVYAGGNSGQCEVATKEPSQGIITEALWTRLWGQIPFCDEVWNEAPDPHYREIQSVGLEKFA